MAKTMACPKCKNDNVSIQIVNEQQLVAKHHSLLWWLCIGWWWIPVKWLFLTIPTLLAAIFIGKRKKIKNITTKKATKLWLYMEYKINLLM